MQEPTFVDVGGIELATWEYGSGDPFLLVHGYTGSSLDWSDVVENLATKHRVITVDQRGHGRSTKTSDEGSYSLARLVSDLTQLVDKLGLSSFHLLGHSMGGMVAMRYALEAPQRLRSLILMDTAAEPLRGAPQMMRLGIELAKTQGLDAVYDAVSPFLGNTPRAEQIRQRMRTKFGQMDVAAFVALGEQLLEHESVLDRLATLRVPTTILLGENDHGLRAGSEALATTIPGNVFTVIPNTGHSPQEDDPAAWLAAVAGHFDRLAAAS